MGRSAIDQELRHERSTELSSFEYDIGEPLRQPVTFQPLAHEIYIKCLLDLNRSVRVERASHFSGLTAPTAAVHSGFYISCLLAWTVAST